MPAHSAPAATALLAQAFETLRVVGEAFVGEAWNYEEYMGWAKVRPAPCLCTVATREGGPCPCHSARRCWGSQCA